MPALLPIDAYVPQVLERLAHGRALVLVAPPGAGKTTRVAPALLEGGPLILLQPRRVAARSLARRIAEEGGWQVGREVGWQVRFEREFSEATRLLVATEGILTARLLADPLLSGFRTVIVDEFHERSVHADLALAFLKQALAGRDDLRVVVMSATLDAAPVGAFLDGCPALEIPGRPHPVLSSRGRRDPRGRGGPGRRRPRGAALARRPRRHGAGSGPRPERAPKGDPGHEHRRNVAHRGRGRYGGGFRVAQGPALRRRAGDRSAGGRADPGRLGRAAGGARGPNGPRPGPASVGCPRPPPPPPRAGGDEDRPGGTPARRDRLGRRPRRVRVVRSAAGGPRASGAGAARVAGGGGWPAPDPPGADSPAAAPRAPSRARARRGRRLAPCGRGLRAALRPSRWDGDARGLALDGLGRPGPGRSARRCAGPGAPGGPRAPARRGTPSPGPAGVVRRRVAPEGALRRLPGPGGPPA